MNTPSIPEPSKRWWNCWLRHSWGRWTQSDHRNVSKPLQGIELKDVSIQIRECRFCGIKKWRHL